MSGVEVVNIEDYWSHPEINWLDYFVSKDQFRKLVEDAENNKDLLVRFAIQFSEQALSTEKEKEALIAKMYPPEDIKFSERKSSSLWLCCLTAVAALNWDFELLLLKSDVLSVRPIIDYIVKIYQNREVTTDSSFGDWLFAKWVVLVDCRFMVTPPPAKQSVNNPGLVADANLLRHESIRRIVVDTREHLRNAISCLEKFIKEEQALFFPGMNCFLKPFLKTGVISMSIGIAGDNALITGPKPDLTEECKHLSSKDVTNKTRCILVDHYFAARNISKAKEHLLQVSAGSPEHILLAINADVIASYCVALGLPSPFLLQGTSKDDLTNPSICENDHGPSRKWRSRRLQSYRTSSSDAKLIFEKQNIAQDILDNVPCDCSWELEGSSKQTEVAKSIVSRLPRVSVSKIPEVLGSINYLCGVVNGFRNGLLNAGFSEPLRSYASSVTYPPSSLPIGAAINKMLNGDNGLWTLLTSFDINELKSAYNNSRPQFFPFSYSFPTMISDAVDLNRSFDLSWFLLGKLEQLRRQMSNGWQPFLNSVMIELGQSIETNRVLFEAVHVLNTKFNSVLFLPWFSVTESEMRAHLRVLQNLLSTSQLSKPAPPRFSCQVLAMYINRQDWMAAIQYKAETLKTYELIQVLCSYSLAVSTPQNQLPIGQLVEHWIKTVSSLFEGRSNKRRNDGSANNYRNQRKMKQELIQFVQLIKEPVTISFLISFFAHLLNRVFLADLKPQRRLFVQHADLLGKETEFPQAHHIAIKEFLHTVLTNGLSTNPNNAHWLRTAGDLHFACGEVNAAMTRYVECLLACRQSFTGSFTETVVDDQFWRKLQSCLVSCSYNTLASLIGQFKKEKNYNEVVKSVELLSQGSLDDREECAHLVHDPLLLESLSHVYWSNHQFNSADRLIQCVSSPALNKSNRPDIYTREKGRKEERLLRILAALVFDTGF